MFQVGNRVRCINTAGARSLNQGGLYTVSSVTPRGTAIRLEGVFDDIGFGVNRFELYVEPVVPAPAANIRRTEEVRDTRYMVVKTLDDNDPTDETEYEYSIFDSEAAAADYIHDWINNNDYILIAKKKLSFTFNVEI